MKIGQTYIPLQIHGEPLIGSINWVGRNRSCNFRTVVKNCVVTEYYEWPLDEAEPVHGEIVVDSELR